MCTCTCTTNERSSSRHLEVGAQTALTDMVFCSCDLDLDLMTFIYLLDLYCLKIYHMSEMNFLCWGFWKLLYYVNVDIRTESRIDRRHETTLCPKKMWQIQLGWSKEMPSAVSVYIVHAHVMYIFLKRHIHQQQQHVHFCTAIMSWRGSEQQFSCS